MSTNLLDCKQIFESAYNKRYTWPTQFNGYKGNCIFMADDTTYESIFSVDKTFKVNVSNVENQEKVKLISSQLFEVTIHRLKRDFEKVHSENNFKLIKEDKKGKEISVSGKNEGDKYRVKDNKINMVFRNIHGLIIEIFVEEFFDTGLGFLSKKYSSQQLDNKSLNPLSPKYIYLDEFTYVERDLWLLNSRSIEYLNEQNKPVKKNFKFENLILL